MASTPIAKAVITDELNGITVSVEWTVPGMTLDRPNTGGWGLGHGRTAPALAKRLAAAVDAQVAYSTPEVRTDIYGQTYVSAASRVSGRMLNVDLSRLGF
jgi:hypothetical protein